jgi:hypothetical protein
LIHKCFLIVYASHQNKHTKIPSLADTKRKLYKIPLIIFRQTKCRKFGPAGISPPNTTSLVLQQNMNSSHLRMPICAATFSSHIFSLLCIVLYLRNKQQVGARRHNENVRGEEIMRNCCSSDKELREKRPFGSVAERAAVYKLALLSHSHFLPFVFCACTFSLVCSRRRALPSLSVSRAFTIFSMLLL